MDKHCRTNNTCLRKSHDLSTECIDTCWPGACVGQQLVPRTSQRGGIAVEPYLEAAVRLHQYIVNTHWDGWANVGPDPIGRINWRITRFVKSYTSWLPWKDEYAYLQGQSYWIRANLILHELTGSSECLDMVGRSTDFIVQKQLANGGWGAPAHPRAAGPSLNC